MFEEEIKESLERKWGKLRRRNGMLYNCRLPFISKQALLNALFLPSTIDLTDYCKKEFNVIIPEDLGDFYNNFNGCRLFFASLSIFGIQEQVKSALKPFDLILENQKNAIASGYSSYSDCPYFFFGSLGGEYIFAYKKSEMTTVYCIKAKESSASQQFDSFSDLWLHYFPSLINEYDIEGRKIHVNEEYKGIPVLENLTYNLIAKEN